MHFTKYKTFKHGKKACIIGIAPLSGGVEGLFEFAVYEEQLKLKLGTLICSPALLSYCLCVHWDILAFWVVKSGWWCDGAVLVAVSKL